MEGNNTENAEHNIVGRFVQKSQTGWNLQYTQDEKYCARAVTNEVQFYESGDLATVWNKLRVEGVQDFALSPGQTNALAVFVPEKKVSKIGHRVGSSVLTPYRVILQLSRSSPYRISWLLFRRRISLRAIKCNCCGISRGQVLLFWRKLKSTSQEKAIMARLPCIFSVQMVASILESTLVCSICVCNNAGADLL
jgi:hypothetical protein